MATVKALVTPEYVKEAYAALASGDQEKIKQYWAEEMVWQVPGHNRLSGWYFGRDEFLAFMGNVGQLSGNSFHMENIAGQVIVKYLTGSLEYHPYYFSGCIKWPTTI